MGNSKGSAASAIRKYDQLPRSVKAALQEARFAWGAGYFYRRFQAGMKATDMVKYIRKIDRAEAIKQASKTWGPDYPIDLIR
jgi:hypothetical protein